MFSSIFQVFFTFVSAQGPGGAAKTGEIHQGTRRGKMKNQRVLNTRDQAIARKSIDPIRIISCFL